MYSNTKYRLTHISKRRACRSNVSLGGTKKELEGECSEGAKDLGTPHNSTSVFLMYMTPVIPNNIHIYMKAYLQPTYHLSLCLLPKEINSTGVTGEGYN